MKKATNISLLLVILFFIFTTCSKDDPVTVTYNLSTSVSPTDGGTISPSSGNFEEGQTVTLTAKPSSERYKFSNWTGGASGTTNPLTITINSDKKISAVFEEIAPIYTDGEGKIGPLGGTVMIDDVNSPLNGVYVKIPEGALDKDKNIKISLAEDDIKFPYDETQPLIKFEPEGLNFLKDVEIGLPYSKSLNDITDLAILNYIIDPEEIDEMPTKNVNEVTKIISASTRHFSYYIATIKEVQVALKMLNINGKIGAKVSVTGNSNLGYGMAGIRTLLFHKNNTALDCLLDENDAEPNTGSKDVYSVFKVGLYEDKLIGGKLIDGVTMSIKREYDSSIPKISAKIYSGSQNNAKLIYESGALTPEDINGGQYSMGEWFSGYPLVFTFNETPENNKKYYLYVQWALSYGNNLQTFNHTRIYGLSGKKGMETFSSMEKYSGNSINEYIDDDFQLWNPLLKTYVPDDNFEEYLEYHDKSGNFVHLGDPDSLGDGDLGNNNVWTNKINKVESLRIENLGIKNLTGIENFEMLKTLDCSSNELSEIDISKNKKLTNLDITNNNIDYIDVREIENLISFDFDNKIICVRVTESQFEKANGWNAMDVFNNINGSYDSYSLYCTPSDLDGDGVSNANDHCPHTIDYTEVDTNGCPPRLSNEINFNQNKVYGNVTDIEGNLYKTIQIGNQTWMAENLRTLTYSNGDKIETYYLDNELIDGQIFGHKYSNIPNKSICPAGWKIPRYADIETLINYLGGSEIAGQKMKEQGFEHWLNQGVESSNSSGFTAIPDNLSGTDGIWWIDDNYYNTIYFTSFYLESSSSKIGFNEGTDYRLCVRCLKSDQEQDSDMDGVNDSSDLCPNTPLGTAVDGTGCEISNNDADGDGVSNANDQCPDTPAGTSVDANGCPIATGNGLTNDINALVPQSVLDAMVNNGMVINTGSTPPNLENIYRVSPFVLKGSDISSDVIGEVKNDFNFQFSNQDNVNLTIKLDYSVGDGSSTGTGNGSFIVGSNSKFTSFSEVNSVENGESAKTVIVISGTKTSTGINNCLVAIYMLDNYGNPSGYFIDNGTGRVFYDSDGFSEYKTSLKSAATKNKLFKSRGLLAK